MDMTLTALAFVPATSASAQASFGTRNSRPMWAFDDTTAESIEAHGLKAANYSAGTINVVIEWAADTATSGNGGWDVSIESVTPDADDLDSDSFASAQSGSDTTASVAGETIETTVTFTQAQADSVADGEMFRIRISRDTAVSGDLTGDIQLFTVRVYE